MCKKAESLRVFRKFFGNRRQEYAEFSKNFDVTVIDAPDSPRLRRLFAPKYQHIEQAILRHAEYLAEHIPLTVLMDGAVYEPDYLGEDFTETAFSVQGAPMLRARAYDDSVIASATWCNPVTHAAEITVTFYRGGGAQIQCLTTEAWQVWWANS